MHRTNSWRSSGPSTEVPWGTIFNSMRNPSPACATVVQTDARPAASADASRSCTTIGNVNAAGICSTVPTNCRVRSASSSSTSRCSFTFP